MLIQPSDRGLSFSCTKFARNILIQRICSINLRNKTISYFVLCLIQFMQEKQKSIVSCKRLNPVAGKTK